MAKIWIYGQGGREHAIGVKLLNDWHQVVAFWWNPGMKLDGVECLKLPESFEDLAKEIQMKAIDVLIVWPEAPLCDGIVDALEKKWILVLWPTQETAMLLEGDKDGAKIFMRENNIPTATSKTITEYNDDIGLYLEQLKYPTVVKANGLAAWKWVKVCKTQGEAIQHIKDCFNKKYDDWTKVVIEACIPGREISAFAFIDTQSGTFRIFNTATDHKAEFDGGDWDNTWGMGTFSPAISNPLLDGKIEEMFENVLAWLKKRGLKYTWPLFAWLMVNDDDTDFNVLEYNVRFGDPETQSMLTRMDGDLWELIIKNAQGKLNEVETLRFSTKKAVTLVLADPGYPRTGTHKWKVITGIDGVSTDVEIYHMGTTKWPTGQLLVNGWRVLSLTASADTYTEAQKLVLEAAKKILFGWEKPKYRTDIGNFAVSYEGE